MTFTITRIIFGGIIFLIGCLIIKKPLDVRNRKRMIINFIAAVLIAEALSLIPIENSFITFSSPEAAYNYNNRGEIKLIVNGGETDFIVGKEGDTYNYAIVPRANGGWKLGMGTDINKVCNTISDNVSISVYRYKNADNNYVEVSDINGSKLDITDDRGSEFLSLESYVGALDEDYYIYYAYINQFDSGYSLTVDGKAIDISF